MKTVATLLIVFFLFFSVATVDATEFRINRGISYMIWKEYLANSRRNPYTEEFGIFYSAGVNGLFNPLENVYIRLGLEGFNGQMDYRGVHLMDNTPHDAKSTFQGIALEETVSYKIKVGKDFYFYPFASLVFSAGSREISAENWYAGYGKLGIQAEKGKFFAKAGVLIPIFTELHSSFKNLPWLNNGRETKFELNPKGVVTPFAEVGIRYKKITLSLSYEQRKWEQSDRVNFEGGGYVFQPETIQNLVSFKVGILF